jgi:hypothetical protein
MVTHFDSYLHFILNCFPHQLQRQLFVFERNRTTEELADYVDLFLILLVWLVINRWSGRFVARERDRNWRIGCPFIPIELHMIALVHHSCLERPYLFNARPEPLCEFTMAAQKYVMKNRIHNVFLREALQPAPLEFKSHNFDTTHHFARV